MTTEERNALVVKYLPLARNSLKRFHSFVSLGITYRDIVQEGVVGLIRAVDNYDGRGKFAQYDTRGRFSFEDLQEIEVARAAAALEKKDRVAAAVPVPVEA